MQKLKLFLESKQKTNSDDKKEKIKFTIPQKQNIGFIVKFSVESNRRIFNLV